LTIDNSLKDIEVSGPLVVGVSTGPDSMALLYLMEKKYKNELIVCHVNHSIRKESKNEELYLKEYCKTHNLCFESITLEKLKTSNIEEEARKKRYEFYEKTLTKYNSKYLFLAHHGDDLIETILMKIVRGSNIEGYSGFKKISDRSNYQIIRPFIHYTKKEIIDFNKENNISYFIDSTNNSSIYTRNRYRKKILPFLKKEDENVHNKFLRYSETLTKYENLAKSIVKNKYKNLFKNNTLNITTLKKEDPLIQEEILYYILRVFYENKKDIIKERHIKSIFSIINNSKPNLVINLPNNLLVRKEYDKLIFTKYDEKKLLKRTLLNDKYVGDGYTIYKIDKTDENGNNICRLNSKDIKLPLYIRGRNDKDKIKLKGVGGTKKIKDIYIDLKIPISKRDSYPLLVDADNEILWIPGLKKSHLDVDKKEFCDIILKYETKEEKN